MYSFDIFDTLITRCTVSPQGVFLVMKSCMQKKENGYNYSNYIIDNFEFLRIEAEQKANKNLNKEAICLEDIYYIFAQMVNMDYEDIKNLASLELNVEIDCSVAIEENIQKVCGFCRRGEQVVLISDMYLSEANIRKILLPIDPIFKEIPIYVSSEYGCTKESGALYVKVKELENVSYENWIHFGDNYMSDVCIPEFLGIKTVYKPLPPLFLWEEKARDYFSMQNDLSLQLMLGAARNIRIQNSLNDAEILGESLGGSILFPYVKWVVDQSIKKGIERLYFVARDGYILKKIADIYIKQTKLMLQTKYVYGSRKAWRVDENSQKEMVRDYLLQEMDLSNDRFAFVDLQGTGRSMVCLAELLKDYIKEALNIFYYNMVQRIMDVHCSYFVYSTSKSYFVEVLCRAPHGMTLGYKRLNEQYVPEMADVDAQSWNDCGLNDYIHGIELFTEKMVQTFLKLGYSVEGDTLGEFLLEYCYNAPNLMVADFFGNIPHSSLDLNDKKVYAPKLSKKEIFLIFMWRTYESLDKYYKGENLKYSIFRLSPWEKELVAFCNRNYSKVLGRAVHFYKKIWHEGKWKGKKRISKRVIVYAAGNVGREAYEKLQLTSDIKVVGWTDMNYKKYQELNYPVKPLNKLIGLKYDILVIAMKSKEKSKKVQRMLVDFGVNPQDIMQIEEFYKKYL